MEIISFLISLLLLLLLSICCCIENCCIKHEQQQSMILSHKFFNCLPNMATMKEEILFYD